LPILRGIFKRDTTELESVVTLARETVPAVLLTYLINVFEAYWEGLAVAIYRAYPHLIEASEAALPIRPPTRPQDVDERTTRLFWGQDYQRVAEAIWDQGLGLSLSTICQAAQTSPQALDRAKAVRNLHIHNAGRVTQKYIDRTGDQTVTVGDKLPVTIEYAVETMKKMYAVAIELDAAAIAAYPQIT